MRIANTTIVLRLVGEGDIVNLCLQWTTAGPYTPPNSCIKYRSLDVCIIEYRSLKVFPNLGCSAYYDELDIEDDNDDDDDDGDERRRQC